MADVLVLLDEYAAAFACGEEPDLRAYLARAGDRMDEFAALVDGYLSRTVAPAPAPERLAATRAWVAGRSPLPEVRGLRGLAPDDVVLALVRRLGLDPSKGEKVARYYAQLEAGKLSPRGVDGRVWEALSAMLRVPAGLLSSWRPESPPAQPALYRSLESASAAMAAPMSKAAEPERDEVDRLFGTW